MDSIEQLRKLTEALLDRDRSDLQQLRRLAASCLRNNSDIMKELVASGQISVSCLFRSMEISDAEQLELPEEPHRAA